MRVRGERRGRVFSSGRANRPECVNCRPTNRSASAFAPKCSRCACARALPAARRSTPPCVRVIINWFGFARPSCRTAAASPPQISFAPLAPKCCHRRVVNSVGLPSAVPSHPSIGRTQNRLPTRTPSTSSGRARGEDEGGSSSASNGEVDAGAGEVVAKGVCRPERGDTGVGGSSHAGDRNTVGPRPSAVASPPAVQAP